MQKSVTGKAAVSCFCDIDGAMVHTNRDDQTVRLLPLAMPQTEIKKRRGRCPQLLSRGNWSLALTNQTTDKTMPIRCPPNFRNVIVFLLLFSPIVDLSAVPIALIEFCRYLLFVEENQFLFE